MIGLWWSLEGYKGIGMNGDRWGGGGEAEGEERAQ